ncbi:hypothetical protein ABTA44_20745, partial [Acinetobacter baumannii]
TMSERDPDPGNDGKLATAAASPGAATLAAQRYPQPLWPLNLRNGTMVWYRNYRVWRKLAIPSMIGNLADPMIYLFGLGLG